MPFRHRPAALLLSRQNLPTIDRAKYAPAAGLAKGAYVLADPPGGRPDVILIGTGSEVALCLQSGPGAGEGRHRGARRQHARPGAFRTAGPGLQGFGPSADIKARVSVEQGVTLGWDRYCRSRGTGRGDGDVRRVRALPGRPEENFGFTVENVVRDRQGRAGRGAGHDAGPEPTIPARPPGRRRREAARRMGTRRASGSAFGGATRRSG